jgi:hypothetical protein
VGCRVCKKKESWCSSVRITTGPKLKQKNMKLANKMEEPGQNGTGLLM